MKKLFILCILVLFAINIHCGGGGGSAGFKAGKTKVTINLGETRTSEQSSGTMSHVSSTIPSNVNTVQFTISAPDIPTITKTVFISGKPSVTETFEVPNGPNRHFLVEARNAANTVIYRGETYTNLDGEPVSLTIVMVSTDNTPPAFGGLAAATPTSTTTIDLSWLPAADNVTPQVNIQYLIYMAPSSGGQNFSSPSFTTQQGATAFTVIGLNPNTTYFFVVRAMDERGLVDSNTTERSAKTLVPPDTAPPSFSGLMSATALSSTEISLQWSPASDDISDASHIDYLIYIATESGAQNLAVPNAASPPGATSFIVSGLAPDTNYYVIVRARDEAYNIDGNTVERVAKTLPEGDTEPPSFGGLVSATALSTTAINLSWDAATDNVTKSSNITYHVFMSSVSQGQNFAFPRDTVVGVTSDIIAGLSQNTTYYFVVRAKDEAGNFETNSIEKSATTLAPSLAELRPQNPFVSIFNISFDVVNSGPVGAVNADVYVQYTDGYSSGCVPASVSVAASSSQPVNVTTGFTPTEYRIIVDPLNGIPESNETNNCISNNPTWCSSPPPATCIF